MAEDNSNEIEKELENMNPEEKKIVYDEIQRVFGSEKIGNIHEFLAEVIKNEDTTKMGYLTPEELGTPNLTLRGYKELSIMSKTFDMPEFESYFKSMAVDVVTSPSLSLKGFLILAAITEKRKLEARLPIGEKKQNSGWFHRGNKQASAGSDI